MPSPVNVAPPALASLSDDALAQHATIRSRMAEIADVACDPAAAQRIEAAVRRFDAIAVELEERLVKDERVLFPWIRAGRGATALAPIRAMGREHEETLARLARLRELTDDPRRRAGDRLFTGARAR
jgi:iron-sulfur cluster repair protein YtfE (RIC family)